MSGWIMPLYLCTPDTVSAFAIAACISVGLRQTWKCSKQTRKACRVRVSRSTGRYGREGGTRDEKRAGCNVSGRHVGCIHSTYGVLILGTAQHATPTPVSIVLACFPIWLIFHVHLLCYFVCNRSRCRSPWRRCTSENKSCCTVQYLQTAESSSYEMITCSIWDIRFIK